MTSVLRSIFPGSSAENEDFDDDYSVEYSFAMEYSGPPVSQDIPQVVPIDIQRIPTASVAARAVMLNGFAVPVVHPIVKSNQSKKHGESDSGSEMVESSSKFVSTGRVYSRSLATVERRFRNHLSVSSDVEDINDECNAGVSYDNRSNATVSDSKESTGTSFEKSSNEGVEDCVVEPSSVGNRTAAVTFRDSPSVDSISEESDEDEHAVYREKPVASNDGKKGSCYKCHKRNRFSEKEVCLVCGAKYCKNCLLRAMGCMPEGRKCITCIGYPIDETRRGSLGKCSRMLKTLLASDAVDQIMSSELLCEINQLPSYLICVNGKPLSVVELAMLQNCTNPPKKLKPGKYWYDKVSGFWGKEGEKPSQIISAEVAIGYRISEYASNGDTNVLINNRRITKAELWMLQAAGINCEGNIHFWLTADGSCMHEGMNNVLGHLWAKDAVSIMGRVLNKKTEAVVIGGMVLDINATPSVASNRGTTTPGKVVCALGGVARNIAECMSKLGAKPYMISAVGFDWAGDLLLEHWRATGLSVEGIKRSKDIRTAIVCNISDGKGELAAAVASVESIEEFLTPEWITSFKINICSAPVVMVDANLSPPALVASCLLAAECETPIWFEPVSVIKSKRVASIAKLITYTSPNEDELIAMANALSFGNKFLPQQRDGNSVGTSIESLFQRLKPAIWVLLDEGIKVVVVTLGSNGVFLCFKAINGLKTYNALENKPFSFSRKLYEVVNISCPPNRTFSAPKSKGNYYTVIHFPALPASIVSLVGAGDCLVGGTLSSICAGLDIMQSVAVGIAAAKGAVETESNVPAEYELTRIADDAGTIYSEAKVVFCQSKL